MTTKLLLIGVGVLTAVLWLYSLTPQAIDAGFNVFNKIATQTAGTPYQQRVLLPAITNLSNTDSFLQNITLFHFILFPAWYVGLWLWLRRFGTQALAITLLSGLYIVLGFGDWGTASTWSLIEMVAVVWLLVFIEHDVIALAIIVIATLNRPFSAFVLPAIYVLYHRRRGLPGVLVYVVVLGAVVLFRPAAEYVMGDDIVGAHWQRNMNIFITETVGNNLMWLPVWGLALLGLRRAEKRFRLLALMIPPYLVMCFLGATIHETRLFLTVYPVAGALMAGVLDD